MAEVVITLAAADVTANVLFASASFTSQVNGKAGTCKFRIRDLDGTALYLPGSEVVLTIDDEVVWRGWAMQVSRVYVFPAINLVAFGAARFFDIEGVDVNVLFEKRIVFDQADPENTYGTLFPAGTDDSVAIADLVDNWLDLSGDGLDTSSGVTTVGPIAVEQAGRAWSAAIQFGQAMASIARLPGAVYYIDPDMVLIYVDDETVTAPFGLSDQPNGTTSRGYREFEVIWDGTQLANDVFAFGIGYGSQTPVARRITDQQSLFVHGRWQQAQVVFGAFKQGTIDYDAESMIYGSPAHLRGAKDDRLEVLCTTFEPGLRVAQKVMFESLASNFALALPIRKMRVDFPINPTTPRYQLTLSFDIDLPFALIDNFPIKQIKFPPIPPIVFPPGGCFLDIYNRPDQQGFGIATTGQPYTESASSLYISAGVGLFGITADNGDGVNAAVNSFIAPDNAEMRALVRWGQDEINYLASIGPSLWHLDFLDVHSEFGRIAIVRSGSDAALRLYHGSGNIPLDNTVADWAIHVMWDDTTTYVNVWPAADPEPSGWMDSGSGTAAGLPIRVQLSSAE